MLQLVGGLQRAVHAIAGWSAEGLVRALRADRLENVDIMGSRFSRAELSDIFEALKADRRCKTFWAANAALDDEAAAALADAIRELPGLEEVFLYMNHGIGDPGVEHLARALHGHKGVKRLILQETGTRLGGAQALAAMLHANDTIEIISLMNCIIPEAGLEALQSAARRHPSLQLLFVGSFGSILGGTRTGISSEQENAIADAVADRKTTLESSSFGAAYAVAVPYDSKASLLDGVRTIASSCAGASGASAALVNAFVGRLRAEIDDKAATQNLREVRQFAGVAWTSQEELEVNPHQKFAFYNMIQKALGDDQKGGAMMEVARYARTLNRFVVTRGAAPVSPFPVMTERGVWLPLLEVKWFTAGRVYRCPRYLATSSGIGVVAQRFLRMYPKPMNTDEQFHPVLMKFFFDQGEGCMQVNFMRGFSMFPDEDEWLFQAYSSFRVRNAADLSMGPFSFANPVVIEIDVLPDNLMVSETVPLAQWH